MKVMKYIFIKFMFSGLDTQIQIKDFLWTGSGWFKRHILSYLQQIQSVQNVNFR